MKLIFLFTYSFWFLSEIILNFFMRSKKDDQVKADKGTLLLIWVVIISSIFLSILISNSIKLPISNEIYVSYIGIIIILFGVLLRLSIISTLGHFFTVNVTIRNNHQLKTDGFYKYLRHPSYFASLLSFIGFGISLNNWISVSLTTVLVFIAFMIRIKVEEKTLIDHFGTNYLEYKKVTKRIIPFVY